MFHPPKDPGDGSEKKSGPRAIIGPLYKKGVSSGYS